MKVNRYWKKYFLNHYGVRIKKIRMLYNPFTSWGIRPKYNYILWGWDGFGFKEIITDKIFHDVDEIEEYLREKEKQRDE